MKMAAGFLLCGAAGMEDSRVFFRRNARKLQLFKSGGGHKWNLSPLANVIGCHTTGFTNFPISRIVFELQREKFQCQFIESGVWERSRRVKIQARSKG